MLLLDGTIVTIEEKNVHSAERDADRGDSRPLPGLLEGPTTFEDLVEQQGVGPFVWPDSCAGEDKIDADDYLKAIFGEEMRR